MLTCKTSNGTVALVGLAKCVSAGDVIGGILETLGNPECQLQDRPASIIKRLEIYKCSLSSSFNLSIDIPSTKDTLEDFFDRHKSTNNRSKDVLVTTSLLITLRPAVTCFVTDIHIWRTSDSLLCTLQKRQLQHERRLHHSRQCVSNFLNSELCTDSIPAEIASAYVVTSGRCYNSSYAFESYEQATNFNPKGIPCAMSIYSELGCDGDYVAATLSNNATCSLGPLPIVGQSFLLACGP